MAGALWRSFPRDRGGRAALAFAGGVALFALWVAFPSGGDRQRTVISDLVVLPLDVAASLFAFRTARHPDLKSATRTAWRRIALALLCWSLGDVLWSGYEVVWHRSPFPSPADAGYLAFYPCLLWGVLSFSGTRRQRRDRIKIGLDTATVMLAGTMAAWYLVVGPNVEQHGIRALSAVLNVAYPVGDLVILYGLTAIVLGQRTQASRRSLQALAAGAGVFMVTDLLYAHLSLTSSYHGGDWPDVGWMAALLLFLVSAEIEHLLAPEAATRPASPPRTLSWLPYGAVGVGYGLLVLEAGRKHLTYPLIGLLLGAVSLTFVVMLRQATVTRENARLREDVLQFRHRELEEANQILTEANRKLSEADRMKTVFLSSVTHELQTPLTSIVGFSNLLLDAGHLEGEAQEFARRLNRNADVLSKLINELLDLSRLENGGVTLALETVRLSEFLPPVLLQLSGVSADHRLELALQDDVTMRADPGALTTIVTNLLSNAVRFSPAGTTVTVAVAADGPWGELSVLDEGPGVPESDRLRVFERFFRSPDPEVALVPGTGIGLALVAELTQRMGGSVTVDNRPVRGAHFRVSLPRSG